MSAPNQSPATSSPVERLTGLEDHLRREVLGQPESARLVARAIQRGEMGYMDRGRPRSFQLLLGETGVGKTETVLTVGRYLYGSEEVVIRLDMAEFGDRRTGLARMVGEGRDEQGLIADEFARVDAYWRGQGRPAGGGRIVLLDEIEKAHPDVSKLFLGLEAARLRMSNGVLLDFQDTHVICTSNLGSDSVRGMSEAEVPYSYLKKQVEEEAIAHFTSPVFARFTEVAVFRSLRYETQRAICRLKLDRKLNQIQTKLGLKITESRGLLDYLVNRGYHRDLGARMMRNTLERELGDAFVEWEFTTDDRHPRSGELQIQISAGTLKVTSCTCDLSPTVTAEVVR